MKTKINIKHKKKNNDRELYNLAICTMLYRFLKENPDLRFFQALQVLKLQESQQHFKDHMIIDDNFNEESEVTYKKLNKALKK